MLVFFAGIMVVICPAMLLAVLGLAILFRIQLSERTVARYAATPALKRGPAGRVGKGEGAAECEGAEADEAGVERDLPATNRQLFGNVRIAKGSANQTG